MIFKEAVEYFGGSAVVYIDDLPVEIEEIGRAGIATALEITVQAVNRWAAKDYVPRGVAYELQVLTRGKLKACRADYKRRENPAIRKENRGNRPQKADVA